VLSLLEDPARATAMARMSAAYVRENFGWDAAAEAFARIVSSPPTAADAAVA
jgi:hypothetical protein